MKKIVLFSILVFLFTGCVNYYTKMIKFNQLYQSSNFSEASATLLSDKKSFKKKNRFLQWANLGTCDFANGNYENSVINFEKCHTYTDEMHANVLKEGATYLLNAKVTDYKPELFENYYVNIYKALSYLALHDFEKATVEARRLNNKMNALDDNTSSTKKFQRDAFAHLTIGLVFDATHEYNNAFIAYRNAYEIYNSDYKAFNVKCPEQLKKDLLRCAYMAGLNEMVSHYEKEMNLTLQKSAKTELVSFWFNGLGPIKEEQSINFAISHAGNQVTFVDPRSGIVFSFPMDLSQFNQSGLAGLQLFRIAYPRYQERPMPSSHALINIQSKEVEFSMAENLNNIAIKTLNDRTTKELSKSLLRLAMKKAAEFALRNQNQLAGSALGVFNAISEQADTRAWQTLPFMISYNRVEVKPEETEVIFKGNGKVLTKKLSIKENQSNFQFWVTP